MGIITIIADNKDESPYSIQFEKESDAIAYMKFLRIEGEVNKCDSMYKIVQNKESLNLS